MKINIKQLSQGETQPMPPVPRGISKPVIFHHIAFSTSKAQISCRSLDSHHHALVKETSVLCTKLTGLDQSVFRTTNLARDA